MTVVTVHDDSIAVVAVCEVKVAATLPDDWQQHMVVAARALRHDLLALSDSIGATVLDDLPELASSGETRREFENSIVGNLDTTLWMYEARLDPRQVPLSQAQVDYARTLARRDVPISALLNAYRLGQSAFMGFWSSHLAASVDGARTLASVVAHSNTMLDHYFTRAAQHALEAYEAERIEWNRCRGLEMFSLTALLDGSEDASQRSEINGYRLPGRHLGVVLVADEPTTVVAVEAARRLARELSTQQVYAIPAPSGCTWAWLGDPRVLPTAEMRTAVETSLPQGIRAAFGRPANGPAGFRSTHRQALQMATLLGRIHATNAWFDDFEIAALTSGDEQSVRDFIDTNLGELGGTGGAAAALRETVRIYLAEQGNARRTAERLFLHRNSVVYRIKSAENMLGRPVTTGQLALQVALHLRDLPMAFGTDGSSSPR